MSGKEVYNIRTVFSTLSPHLSMSNLRWWRVMEVMVRPMRARAERVRKRVMSNMAISPNL